MMGPGTSSDIIWFEQPLNERVRTYLRLEFLFKRLKHHRADASYWGRRAAVGALLDIFLLLGRSDLKGDITKELGEQHAHLRRLEAQPGVNDDRLSDVLKRIEQAVQAIQGLSSQFAGAALRNNDFLVSIANRIAIPGGTTGFDLPNFELWLRRPLEESEHDLNAWCADIGAFERAIDLDLELIRNSANPSTMVARDGIHVQSLDGPRQMLRIGVPVTCRAHPEISAGKHRFTVRFMETRETGSRSHQVRTDIEFRLACCGIG
ncbi:cell division protein ZapD [uncultured Abyssibacter sp.]|uniref:cell division protein ZapD n=1 Tax=uncultured Abyssibacter sp. TaxID=2320202 RepID=UPI0032B14E7C